MNKVRCRYCHHKPIIAEIIDDEVVIQCRCCKRKNVVNIQSQEDKNEEIINNKHNCNCVRMCT